VSQQPAPVEHPVDPLELFFDLVFVFGFTQVTTLLAASPTGAGLGHALLILTALWWAWASYAWLTNTIDPGEGRPTAAMLVATAAMFVAAIAVPGAFGGDAILFGVAFLIVNVMQATLFALAARGDQHLLAAILRVIPWVIGGAVLILVAGLFDGAVQAGFWIAAIVIGFVAPGLASVRGWHLQPGHFVERHGLIVIIAIGESLVAIGLGASDMSLSTDVIVAAVLGLVVATSFWLAYFDFFTIRGRQLLADRSGEDQIAFARDIYTYLHLPMIVGIVLFAFAMKTAFTQLGDHLGTIEALALCGGPALYLFAFVGLRIRVSRSLGHGRLVAAIACTLLVPVATAVPALAALALLAGVWIALHAYELIWWHEARADARAHRYADGVAHP
jgi:low temperature requirement protein LtrA